MPVSVASIALAAKLAECGTARNACDALWRATGVRTRDDDIQKWAEGRARPHLGTTFHDDIPPILSVSAWVGVHVEDWWDHPDPETDNLLPGPDVEDPWAVPGPAWAKDYWE